MKTLKEGYQGISTFLAFVLIPISGFATDIFIPSLPSMASDLKVIPSAVQLTLVIFMVSYGISQWFIGGLLDSFGRYRLGLLALAIFTISSFTIAFSSSITIIYAMRVAQGITTAIIVVSKRAYFVDEYSGDKLKHYTSLFSIVWSVAPIVAPFVGGYFQATLGWQSNFYFLGTYSLLLFITDIIFGGETLKINHPFKAKVILDVYANTIKTMDYMYSLIFIALCYSVLMVYGMSSPFIIENTFHLSPVVTGYCSLLSGVALLFGGLISKATIKIDYNKKITIGIILQTAFTIIMIGSSLYVSNLYTMMAFVILIHSCGGFLFNNFFSYCLTRFTKNAGIAGGITGGSLSVFTSILSFASVRTIVVKDQFMLGVSYMSFAVLMVAIFALFVNAKKKQARVLQQLA